MKMINPSNPEDFQAHLLENIRTSAFHEDFETLFPGKLSELTLDLAWLYDLVAKVINHTKPADIPDHQFYSATLAWKCLNTMSASLLLFTRGYEMEAIGLLRNVVESLALILHLIQKPDLLVRVKHGEFEGRASLSHARKIIPIISKVYGMLSERFSHYHYSAMIPPPTLGNGGKATGLIIGGGFEPLRISDYRILHSIFQFILLVFRNVAEIAFSDFNHDFWFWRKKDGGYVQEWAPAAHERKETLTRELIKSLLELRARRTREKEA